MQICDVDPQNRERNVVQRSRGGIQTCSCDSATLSKEEKHFIVGNDRFNTTIPDPSLYIPIAYSTVLKTGSETNKTRISAFVSDRNQLQHQKCVKRKKKTENGYVYDGHRCKER